MEVGIRKENFKSQYRGQLEERNISNNNSIFYYLRDLGSNYIGECIILPFQHT